MTDHTQRAVADLLTELEETLGQERRALISLDLEEIEACAAKKATLSEILSGRRHELTASHGERVRRLELGLRHNLVLLAQARDHVHGTIEILAGGRVPVSRPSSKPVAEGVRLDVRG